MAQDGSINEVDLMVLTPKGMYVIEIKSHPGVIRGDAVNWVWERPLPKRGQKIFDNPRLLARRKAQKLASLLKLQPSFHLSKETVPFIDALVLLSAEDLVIKLEGDARQGIVSRQELLREITLIDEDWRHRQITAYRRVTNTARQVVQHLRSEQNVIRAFIEGGYGFSVRLTDRIRDIKNAIDRLKRLHEKLGLFTHMGLLQLTRSDRALRGKLMDVLLGAVSRNRFALDEMVGRLDRLSLTVRKRSKMRQVAQAVDAHLQAGGVIDLEPLLERLDAAVWVGSAPLF
ncbi:nuclease-related domain-containing protein [Pseudomonas sp.]|uniref:nuclease-related domain-containing protein n=1 Tax=Pseudomonas sp. TaxID=306 RepID=UPI00390C954C